MAVAAAAPPQLPRLLPLTACVARFPRLQMTAKKEFTVVKRWTAAEEAALKAGIRKYGAGAWVRIRDDKVRSHTRSRALSLSRSFARSLARWPLLAPVLTRPRRRASRRSSAIS